MTKVVYVEFSRNERSKRFPWKDAEVASIQEYRKERVKKLNSALMDSIFLRDRESFEEALRKGADVEASDNLGWTALYLAVWKSDYYAMEELLKRGADPNRRTEFLDLPLCLAAEVGDLDAIDLLLRYGANPSLKRKDPEHRDYEETPAELFIRNGACFLENSKIETYLKKLGSAN